MRNTNKTEIHIHKLMSDQYVFLFFICWFLFKNFIDLQNIVEIKENFHLARKPPKC